MRQTIDPTITGFDAETIKVGAGPSVVKRLTLCYGAARGRVSSAIMKVTGPRWPDDPQGADRELRFYLEVLSRSGPPHVQLYHAGVDPRTQSRVILMEDLAHDYEFYPPDHVWTRQEARCLMRAYARLHALGRHRLMDMGQQAWMYRMELGDRQRSSEALLSMVTDLAARGVWPRIRHIDGLVEWICAAGKRYARCPATLVHHDVYPSNFGLPRDPRCDEGILIDWQMGGWGLAEIDLAYMFTQPFGSERELDRAELLDYYWAQRQNLEGHVPAREHRAALQRYADVMLALWLVPVAWSAAAAPYPSGSSPAAYWKAMFQVLQERLTYLCHSV